MSYFCSCWAGTRYCQCLLQIYYYMHRQSSHYGFMSNGNAMQVITWRRKTKKFMDKHGKEREEEAIGAVDFAPVVCIPTSFWARSDNMETHAILPWSFCRLQAELVHAISIFFWRWHTPSRCQEYICMLKSQFGIKNLLFFLDVSWIQWNDHTICRSKCSFS